MRGFIDLHCHWIAGIDDGARSPEDGIQLLSGLYAAGFSTVVATPHMRPGLFDNDRPTLERAFEAMRPHLAAATATLPEVHLASEHFFDDVVFGRLTRGEGLPYPPQAAVANAGRPRGVLVEFPAQAFPARVQHRFFDLRRAGLVPVLAHPERYHPVWTDDSCLDPLLDAGAHLLLDVCSLVGKYGRSAQRAAEKLLEEDAYEAACSDAHSSADVAIVVRALERLEALVGKDDAERLLGGGPRGLMG